MPTLAYVGVDVGTSSTKGVLVGPDGAILRSATRAHAVQRPAPGHVEMDARVWWDELVAIVTLLTDDLAPGAARGADVPGDLEVAALGVSGMGPCVLLADEAGEPVRPAILYGVDTRATRQIAELDAALGRDTVLDRCGSALSSQAAGPKIAWVREHEPDVWARARRLFMPASYLAFRLTGAYVLDHHSASQSTPLYDPRTHAWIDDWADLVAPGLELPALRWAGEAAGVTREPLGGVPAGTPVTTGTIDAWSEAVSVDAHRVGDLMVMYGTTTFLVATVAEPLRSETMWGTVGAYPGTHNLAGGTATSGAITSWLRELTGADYPDLLAEAAASGPGAQGLLMLPYLAGERTPVQDPHARGVVAGLTLEHTRGDLYRAALEATAFAVRHNLETMRDAGAEITRAVAVGGGTQGDLWTQIVSDVTGLPQAVPARTIGASYGAAMLAAGIAHEHGHLVDVAAWNPPVRVVEPDPALRATYDELYALYRDLYPASRAVVHALTHRTEGAPA
ncbi:FGGY-family carbohydrate kinase [Cellulosimicrobium sp. CUA-896]|uniref:FGGY-family carbohydrate kinase n=1 Tax=Cellulosimicrobium sp. CUA-896 TaxID=1517881 RepID=UPI0009696E66|nr:FGGY-family carbohydrate kinase [Cellulosimicrobium sp. CUA-896]OLT53255.1 sugar kinase [Cellulosimicrobium sp. CUA-896]